MFFVVSKILGTILVHPINLLVLCALVGGLATTSRALRPWGRGLVVFAALLFIVACYTPLAALLLRPLEDRFPRPGSETAPAGIIVLGGAMDADLTQARGQTALTEAASRLTAGAALARRFPEARLVFTGGSADLRQKGLDEAGSVRDLWLSLGVDDGRMTFEDRSRNTFENVALTKQLAMPRPGETWLLVTSAAHMPRSVGIFRSQGWPVVAYPVDYRTFGDARDWKLVFDPVQSLRNLSFALHEWVGLAAYRLSGKTNVLFPSP